MNTVNLDDLIAAMETPTFVLNGQTYTTRPLSFNATIKLQNKFQKLQSGEDTLENLGLMVEEACEAVGLPATIFTELPTEAFMQAVNSFFTFLLGNATSPELPAQ